MIHDGTNWLMKTRRAALIFSAALLPLMAFAAAPADAQSIMRTPNLNIGARTPTINPTITPRINPSVAARITWAPIAWRGRRRHGSPP
jgi:hypothetical protein